MARPLPVRLCYHAQGLLTANHAVERAWVACGRALDRIRRDNFLVLSSVRSGTTMMVEYLNCCPQVRCHGEILGPGHFFYGYPYRMGPRRLLTHVESFFVKRPGRLAGAKIMTFHLDELPISLDDLLETLHQPKVIVLYRANVLDQFISLQLAERHNHWHLTRPREVRPIWIDPDECLAFVQRERRMWHENLATLAGRGAHVLSYEYLARRPELAMREVFGYLGVHPATVRTQYVPTNPKPAWQKVTNYRQLAERGLPRLAMQRLPYLEQHAAAQAA